MRSLSGTSHRPPIPDLTDGGVTYSTATEKASALNSFFVKQTFLDGQDGTPDSSSLPVNEDELLAFSTTASDVFDVLSALPQRKAPGLDGNTTHLLRECARGIASSLALLFNRSFSEQCFPDPWKDAVVVPVFKRGDRSLLTIDPLICYRLLAKYVNGSYTISCTTLCHRF